MHRTYKIKPKIDLQCTDTKLDNKYGLRHPCKKKNGAYFVSARHRVGGAPKSRLSSNLEKCAILLSEKNRGAAKQILPSNLEICTFTKSRIFKDLTTILGFRVGGGDFAIVS